MRFRFSWCMCEIGSFDFSHYKLDELKSSSHLSQQAYCWEWKESAFLVARGSFFHITIKNINIKNYFYKFSFSIIIEKFMHFLFTTSLHLNRCLLYFFLLIIQSFSHGIGNLIFTFWPFTPGLISEISCSVSASHSWSILNSYGLIWLGIIISKIS